MGLIAMLPNYNPACRKSFSIVETVKEASAVCRSFLDGVVIFTKVFFNKIFEKSDKWKFCVANFSCCPLASH